MEVNVLLSCGNDDKTLKINRDCTFDEFRVQVKSLFPHLPEVSKLEPVKIIAKKHEM